jgi:hypothetical protein
MARKKQLDKLSLDMIQCKKDGYGVRYGAWKATQKDKPVKPIADTESDDLGCTRVCVWCGKEFYRADKRVRSYCSDECRQASHREHRSRQGV